MTAYIVHSALSSLINELLKTKSDMFASSCNVMVPLSPTCACDAKLPIEMVESNEMQQQRALLMCTHPCVFE